MPIRLTIGKKKFSSACSFLCVLLLLLLLLDLHNLRESDQRSRKMKRNWDSFAYFNSPHEVEIMNDACDLIEKVRMSLGDKGFTAFSMTFDRFLERTGQHDDIFNDVLALFANDPVFFQGLYRFKPGSWGPPVSSAYVLDFGYLRSMKKKILKADEQKKMILKSHDEVVKNATSDKSDEFVNKTGGFATEGGGSVVERLTRDGLCFFQNVQKKLECKESYQAFIKLFFYFSNGKIGKAELDEKISSMIGNYSDLMEEFQHYVADCKNAHALMGMDDEQNKRQKLEARRCKEKDENRKKPVCESVHELDRPKRQTCTPSYQFRSEGYHVSSRAEHKSQVLNDDLISVPSSTGHYSCKDKQKNWQQEILLRCQDDQLEMDLLVSWFTSAVEYAEELGEGIDEESISKIKKTHFLRCVERLYGEYGLEMLEIFDKDPQFVLPVLRERLKQKVEELKNWRKDLQKLWDAGYMR